VRNLRRAAENPISRTREAHGESAVFNFSTSFLLMSLLWGTVGGGYFIYGKKQGEWLPMVGGGLLVGVSCLVGSALYLTLISVALIAAMHYLMKLGY
jgi:hypothetical protein